MASNIKLDLSNEIESFISDIRRANGEPYLVPTLNWKQYIFGNTRCPEKLPPFIEAGSHVITESDGFRELINRLGNLQFKSQRLLTNIGAIWGAVQLEERKPPPKGDIFDYAIKQPGSFRSNG